MPPKPTQMAPFKVSGLGTRTANRHEMPPSPESKIAGLWQQFFSEDVSSTIANRIPDTPVYGVYSNYESDHNGYFDLIAGVKVSENAPAPMQTIEIEGGDYLVFDTEGEMPERIIKGWMDVYAYFESDTPYKRRFTTDFEQYAGENDMTIYIAVKTK